MDESLPCPVCGGRAWAHYEPTTIRIHCPCCDRLGPEKDTIDEARAAGTPSPVPSHGRTSRRNKMVGISCKYDFPENQYV